MAASTSGIVKVENTCTLILAGIGSYHFNSNGALLSASYSGAKELDTSLSGSYNTFLGTYSWLRVLNTSADSAQVTVTINSGSANQEQRQITIPDHGRSDLQLLASGFSSVTADSYGSVSVEAATGLVAEVLRAKPTSNMEIDFVNSTSLG